MLSASGQVRAGLSATCFSASLKDSQHPWEPFAGSNFTAALPRQDQDPAFPREQTTLTLAPNPHGGTDVIQGPSAPR